MIDRVRDWVKARRRDSKFMVVKLLPTEAERVGLRRLASIREVLGSGGEGYRDVFTERWESGYGEVHDIARLRLDLSDAGIKTWLKNVELGLDQSLRTGNNIAVENYNQVLDAQCQIRPEGRKNRVA